MARNQLKKSTEPTKDKETKDKKTAFKLGFISKIKPTITGILNNEKVTKITGLVFLVFSVFLLLALSAYLFTWKIDQDKLNHTWNEILFNSEIQVENWLGKLGALVSHQLIYAGFGISAFLLPFLTFLIGFRILFKSNLLPLSKSFRYTVFSMVWLSIAFGYVFSKTAILGGAFGYQTNIWIGSIIGNIGVGLVLFLSLLIFLVFNFNISFDILPKKEIAEEKDIEPFKENSHNIPVENEEVNFEKGIDEETETPLISKAEEPIELTTESITDELDIKNEESEPKDSIILDSTPPIVKTESTSDEIEFSVEETENEDEVLSESELNKKVAEFGEYDPTLDLSSYQLPSIDLLKDFGNTQKRVSPEELEANKNRILETLGNYNIKIASIKATIGPTVTLYEIVPEAGVRISKIKNLEDDIALSLAALGIRIIAPIPGKGTIGIEVPNQNPEVVPMRNVIASDKFQNAKMELPVVMGKTITNETFVFDLAKMPHLLMAGATGQGKSVGLNAVLTSLLYKKHPAQLKFVLVDPKKVELTLYNKIERHFLAKLPDSEDAIITDNQKVINTLNSLCIEMDQRYELLKNAMVRNIVEYNAKFIARKLNPNDGHKFLPYIVLVIDEFADLIMTAGKEVETPIARLAQLARAIGIHLIIATQRPSANIITGIIKANFPGRIAFRVTSGIDSRTILDSSGADQLIGKGDMLFSQGNDLIRVQCAFVDTPEVERICEFIGNQRGYPEIFTLPEYVGESATGGSGTFDDEDKDALFDDAARMLVQHQQGSASLLQRKMKIGYNRAGRLIDQMEAAGIIGPFEGSKARQVLISDLDTLEQFLKDMNQ
ncbi:DNA translocase FtsK [Vicingus serpentipes]|uniref:DNA translocase FtsK n=1 Tax=Vicingus serpentipes TaxID=1926625 RepID=A0A5C6RWW7_9FLAO|nr:DNA translocase FtsK [Vicingus serpentipes]TXB67066.1 DNA translocase FtsK [Vicingus serpentipes]